MVTATQVQSHEATMQGATQAASDGKITFTFTRLSHHMHLSSVVIESAGGPMVGIMHGHILCFVCS